MKTIKILYIIGIAGFALCTLMYLPIAILSANNHPRIDPPAPGAMPQSTPDLSRTLHLVTVNGARVLGNNEIQTLCSSALWANMGCAGSYIQFTLMNGSSEAVNVFDNWCWTPEEIKSGRTVGGGYADGTFEVSANQSITLICAAKSEPNQYSLGKDAFAVYFGNWKGPETEWIDPFTGQTVIP